MRWANLRHKQVLPELKDTPEVREWLLKKALDADLVLSSEIARDMRKAITIQMAEETHAHI